MKGRDGKPITETAMGSVALMDRATGAAQLLYVDDHGVATGSAAAGSYEVAAYALHEGSKGLETTVAMLPELAVKADTRATLDATGAKLASFAVPEGGYHGTHAIRLAHRDPANPGVGYSLSFMGVTGDRFYVKSAVSTGGPGTFEFGVKGLALESAVEPSPYRYNLQEVVRGRIPHNPVFRVTRDKLSVVDERLTATEGQQTLGVASYLEGEYVAARFDHQAPNPGVQRNYYSIVGGSYMTVVQRDDMGMYSLRSDLRSGKRTVEDWFKGPLQPGAPTDYLPGFAWENYDGLDFLVVYPSAYRDNHPNHWFDRADSQIATLFRDGVEVGTTTTSVGYFQTPEGTGDFRLDMVGTDPALGTNKATWTFKSASEALFASWKVDGLDADNSVAAGATVPLRLTVGPLQRRMAAVTDTTAEISFDGGKTWSAIALRGHHGKYCAEVKMPKQPGTVALRMHATDAAGGTVSQAMEKAFSIRG